MFGFLLNISKVLTRKTFRVLPLNTLEKTASQIETVNHKQICNGNAKCCNVTTTKTEMPEIFSDKDFHINPINSVSKIISTPNFPDSSTIGAVTWIKRPLEDVNLYDVIMKIETDKSFVYISAPSDGTIAELLVEDGAKVRPGQQLVKFITSTSSAEQRAQETKYVTNIVPPSARTTDTIIAAPKFPDSSDSGVIKWITTKNEPVDAYQILLRIETDKTYIYVPAPAAGTIVQALVKDGERISPGQNLFKFDIKDLIKSQQSKPKTDETSEKQQSTQKYTPESHDPIQLSLDHQLRSMKSETNIEMNTAAMKSEMNTAEMKTAEMKTAEMKTAEMKTAEMNTAEMNTAEMKTAEMKTAEMNTTEMETAAMKTAEMKSEMKTTEMEPAEMKSTHKHRHISPQIMTTNRVEYRVNVNNFGSKIMTSRLTGSPVARDMLTTLNEIDMGNIILWRKQNLKAFQKKYNTKFGFMSVFCKACATALQQLPRFNAFMDGNDIVYHNYADISVALPSPKGYILPVLRNVDKMNCADIGSNIDAFINNVDKGYLGPEGGNGGTFTITNAGKFGSLMGTPIITPPKSTVLGMHGIFDRPVAYKGKIDIRPMMYVALTYEHRLVDGYEASLFLNRLKTCIEDPSSIVGCTEL